MALVGLLEDNAPLAHLCATMLNYVGYQVTLYGDPQACLQALLAAGEVPESTNFLHEGMQAQTLPVEVLILDLHLPEFDGIEFLRRLQSHPHTQSLPLIICTAATDAEIASALSTAPRAVFVKKPFNLQTLISAIVAVLKAS